MDNKLKTPKRTKILGTPGCGKTRKLLELFVDFIQNGHYYDDITMTTFRKSAALDLIGAVSSVVDEDTKELKKHIGTLHSICYRLIGHPPLMTSNDYIDFINTGKYKAYLKGMFDSVGETPEEEVKGDLFDLYSWCKHTMTPVDKWYRYPRISDIKLPKDRIPQFFEDYEAYKKKINKIDFSDMLQAVLDDKISLDTSILMIDEFQDLTPQMFAIIDMWSKECEHVIIAGDPFQSIYGFFGGTPDFFNNWIADKEIVLPHSHRLPLQIKDFARAILRINQMVAPNVTAKYGFGNTAITKIKHSDKYPVHHRELHLVRANYQSKFVAFRLANDGKIFEWYMNNRHHGWTPEEVNLANAIIILRSQDQPKLENIHLRAIVNHYPEELLRIQEKKSFITVEFGKFDTQSEWLPPSEILQALKSDNPTQYMTKKDKLFIARINGVKDRTKLIDHREIHRRRIMTIHGAKGLEAHAVFLHTGITTKIKKAIIVFSKNSQEEARVWYVGATRALEHLYLVEDKGANYRFPTIPTVYDPIHMAGGVDLFADDDDFVLPDEAKDCNQTF